MNNTLFDTVIFDLDGTLINSLPDVLSALNKTLKKYGRAAISLEQLLDFISGGAKNLIINALRITGDLISDKEIDSAKELYLSYYRNNPVEKTYVYPGVFECLDVLKDNNINLVLCSNKPNCMVDVVLEKLGLKKYFDAISGGDDVKNTKPAAEHLKFSLDKMQKKYHQVIMCGDGDTDILAARAFGIPIAWVSYGYLLALPENMRVDFVLDKAIALLDVIGLAK